MERWEREKREGGRKASRQGEKISKKNYPESGTQKINKAVVFI